jgi:hypothetical protein
MLLHLRQWMWRNEKLFLRGKNKKKCITRTLRGFVL